MPFIIMEKRVWFYLEVTEMSRDFREIPIEYFMKPE